MKVPQFRFYPLTNTKQCLLDMKWTYGWKQRDWLSLRGVGSLWLAATFWLFWLVFCPICLLDLLIESGWFFSLEQRFQKNHAFAENCMISSQWRTSMLDKAFLLVSLNLVSSNWPIGTHYQAYLFSIESYHTFFSECMIARFSKLQMHRLSFP